MSAVNVFGACVVLRVVREVDGGHIVHAQGRGLRGRKAELSEEGPQVDRLFGCFRGSHDLGFARREGNRWLFLGGPRYRSLTVDEYVARRGVPRRPVGI
eukprot:1729981-Pleurochrysis_carterae.AAC.1